jgi:hypothetical protein
MTDGKDQHWLDALDDEDLAFTKRFILTSGSLKELAQAYNVSYPTVRLRLDRLIQKIRIVEDARVEDSFERLLRAQFSDGRLDASTFKNLLSSYRKQKKNFP